MARVSLDNAIAHKDLKRKEECFRLLLDAGSDLSSVSFESYCVEGVKRPFWVSASSEAFMYGSFVRYSSCNLVFPRPLITFRPE